MIKCANCLADADYTYSINEDTLINYCAEHLPNFLASRKASGQLNLVVPAIVEDVVEESAKSSKKKTVDPVVEEVPEEEPVTE
jgi:hypothetical protein